MIYYVLCLIAIWVRCYCRVLVVKVWVYQLIETPIAICDLCTDGLSVLIKPSGFKEYSSSCENGVKPNFLCLNKFCYLCIIHVSRIFVGNASLIKLVICLELPEIEELANQVMYMGWFT